MMKLILFDFDGTIADSLEAIVNITNTFSERYKFRKITLDKIEDLRNKSFTQVFKDVGLKFVKAPFLIRRVKKEFEHEIDNIKIYPGIKPVLKELSKTYKLGILTNNTKKNVESFLLKNDLEMFSLIYDAGFFSKARKLKRISRIEKIPLDKIIYVGDEIRDIKACKKAGVQIIAVTWGFNSKRRLKIEKPDYMVDNAKDILKILK